MAIALNPNFLLSTVCGITGISASILAEDSGFRKLLMSVFAESMPYDTAVETLTDYIQSNY